MSKNRYIVRAFTKSLIFVFYFFEVQTLLAQHRNNNNIWYLSWNFGINFNFSPPELYLRDNETELNNQVATYCDSSGNLIFYAYKDSACTANNIRFRGSTEGNTLNRNDNTSIVTFRKPGMEEEFYILFALASKKGPVEKGIFGYHKIKLQDSTFEVIENLKPIITKDYSNIFRNTSITVGWFPEEKCYFVFISLVDEKRQYIYKIDSNGFNLNPIYAQDFNSDLNPNEVYSALSPSGSIIAGPGLRFARFNEKNGTLFNEIDLEHRLRNSIPNYLTTIDDIEFSPSGRYLYTIEGRQNQLAPYDGEKLIVQYDLEKWDADAIYQSRSILKLNQDLIDDCFTRGPDNRIYFATHNLKTNVNNIGAIINPDDPAYLIVIEDSLIYIKTGLAPIHNFPTQVVYTIKKNKPYIDKAQKICDSPIKLALLGLTMPSKILWNTGDTTSSILVSKPGKYTVKIESWEGISFDTIQVEKGFKTQVYLGPDTGFCKKFLYTISNSQHKTEQNYNWNTGSTAPKLAVSQSGNYSVVVKEKDLCPGYDTIQIKEYNYPYSLLPQDTVACLESALNLSVYTEPSWKISWSNGFNSQKTLITQEGTYHVTIDYNGCILSDTITVKSSCAKIFVPNSFSPDGDNLNERFAPSGETILEYDLKIFNRWGELVYCGNLSSKGWDGTFDDKPCQEGVYSYYISYTLGSGTELRKGVQSGMLHLIR